MDKAKRKRLEARGWRVGTASDFLRLSPEEAALVQMKVSLSRALRARREALPRRLAAAVRNPVGGRSPRRAWR